MMSVDFIKNDKLRNWLIYFIYAPITNSIAWFRYDDFKKNYLSFTETVHAFNTYDSVWSEKSYMYCFQY